MNEHIFTYIIMFLMLCACVVYLYKNNYPMTLYWLAGFGINVAVIWGNKGG